MPRRKEHGFVVPLSNPRCCAHCIRAPWLSFAILTSFWHHRPPWSASASRVVPGVMNGGAHRLDCQAPGLSKQHPLCLCDLFGGILVFWCVSHEISRACFMRSFSGAQTRGGHVATVVWGGQFAPLPKPTSQGGACADQTEYIHWHGICVVPRRIHLTSLSGYILRGGAARSPMKFQLKRGMWVH